jgi:hypothetical protein
MKKGVLYSSTLTGTIAGAQSTAEKFLQLESKADILGEWFLQIAFDFVLNYINMQSTTQPYITISAQHSL